MKEILEHVVQRLDLSEREAGEAFNLIMDGQATPAQLGALLTALKMKGETVDELCGAAQSMRRHAVFVDPRGLPVIDTCGTGGDASGSFNVSTTAALIAAGAGVPVAKHGNRSVTSACGSADVLEQLGVNVDAPAEVMEECLAEVGIAFLFAPKLHPAMKHAMGPRRELGFRTLFNLLGPLTNPAGARAQVLGVFAPALTEMFAEVLRRLGSRHVLVVHGHDGMDEVTTTTRTRVSELSNGRIRTFDFDPLPLLGRYAASADLRGGDPAENAAIVRCILAGEAGPPRDIACLNAAAGLVAAEQAADLREGLEQAYAAVDSGKAKAVLERLVAKTRAD
ncbi:MAG: anthranilate phosphoribosyltransferase [Candidatus Aminicenantes bacterium RBG_16_63_16]|nr:MAG: anthranilate phosphoribosyltransferase [Candidatus Aminicenantes bacterium RBG_16_63_16]